MRCALLNEHDVVIACHELDNINDWPGYVPAEDIGNPGDTYNHMTSEFTSPVVDDAAIFSAQKKTYLDDVRGLRSQILARLNGYGAALYLQDPPAQVDEKANCAALIQGLLDITTIPSVLAATTLAELTAAVKTEYAHLVSTASTELLKAFRQVDV